MSPSSSSSNGERLASANDTCLCAETFGEPGDPPVLLIGHSLLSWPGELCARLAAGRRLVVRYDQRDTGRSTTLDPGDPAYTLRDLVGDAAGLLDTLDMERAHVAGLGTGGWIAQLLALDHPARVATLTLVGTRPTAPGPSDDDLPDHDKAVMAAVFGAPQPDWTDRDQVMAAMAASGRHFAGSGGYDEADARELVGQVFDRAAAAGGGAPSALVHQSNQMAIAFAAMNCRPRWRERLDQIAAPTLVVHGEDDPFFPIANGEALAREIPGAELLRLEGTGQELPRRDWDTFATAVLEHTAAATA
jgi:pimeloyl-ACP methyl ester carboxylesterase